jgi:hypothetical protein
MTNEEPDFIFLQLKLHRDHFLNFHLQTQMLLHLV